MDPPACGSVSIICASCVGFVSDFEIQITDFSKRVPRFLLASLDPFRHTGPSGDAVVGGFGMSDEPGEVEMNRIVVPIQMLGETG